MSVGKISIIVPVYNAEAYLNDCFCCLREQTYENWEAIFINDGSRDGSEALIREMARLDSRFVMLNQANSGVSAARNLGLCHASGEYLYFLDADDRLESNALFSLVSALKAEGVSAVRCGYIHETEEGIPLLSVSVSTGVLIGSALQEHIRSLLSPLKEVGYDGSQLAVIWNTLFRRECLVGLTFDTGLFRGEDTLFLVGALLRCSSIIIIPDQLYHYIQHAGSAMGKYHKEFEENLWQYMHVLDGLASDDMTWADQEEILSAAMYSLAIQNLMNICRAPGLSGSERRKLMRSFLSQDEVVQHLFSMKRYVSGLDQRLKLFLLTSRSVFVLEKLFAVRLGGVS